jgi:branched-chain amino acid transport system ATP-binding protein
VLIGLHLKTEPEVAAPLARAFFITKKFIEKEKAARARAEQLIDLVGLTPRCKELAKNLAGPDQRRLQIAIALGAEPDLLLLDEPVAGMRPDETGEIAGVIEHLLAQSYTILLVEHNMRFVMGLCKRIIVLDHGVKIAEGMAKEIYSNSEVRRVYLGGEG